MLLSACVERPTPESHAISALHSVREQMVPGRNAMQLPAGFLGWCNRGRRGVRRLRSRCAPVESLRLGFVVHVNYFTHPT